MTAEDQMPEAVRGQGCFHSQSFEKYCVKKVIFI